MPRPLNDRQRKELSVGAKKQSERTLPEYVEVFRLGQSLYAIRDGTSQLYEGNESQVHNWLGRHDYQRVTFSPGSWVLGTFKRPKEQA